MNSDGITKVVRNAGDPLPADTGTDWAAVEALSEEAVHAAAMDDPDARPMPADGKGLRKLVNVKKLRERLGMTQEQFAMAYRIPVGTLRDWEQHRKNPDAPARAYLHVIERNPALVAGLLDAA